MSKKDLSNHYKQGRGMAMVASVTKDRALGII